jgi:hypothetical protein
MAPSAGILAETRNSPSPNAGRPAKVDLNAIDHRRLDFQLLGGMVAQPLGSSNRRMRNIITKILIVVAPRRIAGDG